MFFSFYYDEILYLSVLYKQLILKGFISARLTFLFISL